MEQENEPIYKKIFEKYFRESEKGEGANLEKAFKEIVLYLEKLNTILKTGSSEEKKKAIEEYAELKKLIRKRLEKYKEESGLSETELKKMMQDPKKHSRDDLEIIQSSVEEIKSMKDLSKNIQENLPEESAKPKKKKSKDKWLKS
ncbi:MAG: hypothetical protein HY860_06020 [Chlamydiales bacterium]|nr:hypothetical protein [Chlamydiales bacterium]